LIERVFTPSLAASPLRDERLQASHVHLPQRQVSDEGVQLPQERGIVSDALLVLVLLQEPGCRCTKRTIRPKPIDSRRANLVYPPGEAFLGFASNGPRCGVGRNPLFAHQLREVLAPISQELLVDMEPPAEVALGLDDQMHVRVLLVGVQDHGVAVLRESLNSPTNAGPLASRNIRFGRRLGNTKSSQAAARSGSLNLGLFGHFEGVINLDPKVPDCTFQL
jgi:hypothetical protein